MTHARKSLSQNFLIDPNIQKKIVNAIEPHASDEILEIGPGTGALTRLLAHQVHRLVAIEIDDQLAIRLAREFENHPGVRILHDDALRVPPTRVTDHTETLKIVGNIPYHITTPLLFRLLEPDWRPATLVLMVQKEVARRVLASAGTPDYGALSVGVQSVARAERLFDVGRNAFRPVPTVDSTVIRITPLRPPPLSEREEHDLRSLTQAAFGWRRKQLQHTLRKASTYALDATDIARLEAATGLELDHRPETLSPTQLISLARALRAIGRPHH